MKLSLNMLDKTRLSHDPSTKFKGLSTNPLNTHADVKSKSSMPPTSTLTSTQNKIFSQISPKLSSSNRQQIPPEYSNYKTLLSGPIRQTLTNSTSGHLLESSPKSHLQFAQNDYNRGSYSKNLSKNIGIAAAAQKIDVRGSKIGVFAKKLDFLIAAQEYNKANAKSNTKSHQVSKAESLLSDLPHSPLADRNQRLFTSYEPTPSNLKQKNPLLRLKTEDVNEHLTSQSDSNPSDKLKGILTSPSTSASSRLSKTDLLLNNLISPTVKPNSQPLKLANSKSFYESGYMISKKNKGSFEFGVKSPGHMTLGSNLEIIRQSSPTNFSLFSPHQQRSSLTKQLIRSSQERSVESSQKEIRVSYTSEVPNWKLEKASQKTSSRKSSEAPSELEEEISRLRASMNLNKETSNKFVNKASSRPQVQTQNFEEIMEDIRKKGRIATASQGSNELGNFRSSQEFAVKSPEELDTLTQSVKNLKAGFAEFKTREFPQSTKNLQGSAPKFRFETVPNIPIRLSLEDAFLHSTQEGKRDLQTGQKFSPKGSQGQIVHPKIDENDFSLELTSHIKTEEVNQIREGDLVEFEGTPIKHEELESLSQRGQRNSLPETVSQDLNKGEKKAPKNDLEAVNEDLQGTKAENEVEEQLLKLRERLRVTLEAHRNREIQWKEEKFKLLERIQLLEEGFTSNLDI